MIRGVAQSGRVSRIRYAGVSGDDKSEINFFVCDEEIREENRGVAQSGSAPALGAGCRRFKSSRPDQ